MNTLEELSRGHLQGAKRLTLSCGLNHFPEEIFGLSDSLEILDLSNNQLSHLPDRIAELHNLKILFLTNNQFKTFPEILAACPRLTMISFKQNLMTRVPEQAIPKQTRWLILTDNQISRLPKSIGECRSLEKVALAGNLLESLPEEMANCREMALLRISANRLGEIPDWLLTMPRLSWLAFSGNPCCRQSSSLSSFPTISWNNLEILQTLGQGASGVISKAIWHQHPHAKKEVAVKVFKGTITSDGFAEDEMAACILSEDHPHLVKSYGRLTDHPLPGLVFELIPPTFSNLGLPPSLETCSRDTFKEGTRFAIRHVEQIAVAIASAMNHLHQRGIMHGDLYAHNILVDGTGKTIFGDFGAASLYEPRSRSAEFFQRIDISGYGCLLDDLLRLNSPAPEEIPLGNRLHSLSQQCLNPTVLNRPGFQEILSILANSQ